MHYVIGDIHGHFSCLMELLNKLNLKDEDIVTFVGDVCDRAPSSKEQANLLRWCFDHISNDGQFRMVLGNHELEHIEDIQNHLLPDKTMDDCLILDRYGFFPQCYNEGLNNTEIYNFLKTLPLFYKYEINNHDYFVTHSWICGTSGESFGGYEENLDVFESVWDRDFSVYNSIPEGTFTVIHGHTPTMCDYYYGCNPKVKPLVIKRKGNINLDCGLFWRSRQDGDLAAYCIETDEVIYLYGERNKVIEVSPKNSPNIE